MGESGSQFFHIIPEPKNFSEVTRLSYYIKNLRLKKNQKEITNLINNQNFLFQEPEKGDTVNLFMDVNKSKIYYDGSLYKLKLRIMIRGDIKNKYLFGDTWSSTAFMRTLKYFSANAAKHKERVHKLDFIGSFLQAKIINKVFVKLDSRYAEYFPEYSNYFGRGFRLLNSMYGMTNSGKLFAY